MGNKQTNDQYSEEETARRRDEALLRALSTPPKHHSEMKVGRATAKKKTSPKNVRKKPNG
jgi:hypothetical protein